MLKHIIAKMLGNTDYKQVVLVRIDLKLPPGKLAAQVAHASVEAVLRSDEKIVKSWRSEGMKKIVLKVKNEKELRKYQQQAKDSGIVTALITDAGHTVVASGTVTCLAIGPAREEEVDRVTGELQIL
ncbi:MAG TPA: peptidyl-tRNA hydrolase Pth2 [Candidatus Nanoarchaeia archaeon]|nr:peptidyl-tRNA hydrolase Pth2 [Candidatus Nanoarchaeia archaeon]